MNVGQLEEIFRNIKDKSMDVMLDQFDDQFDDECRYGMAQKAFVKGVQFQAPDVPKKEWPTIDCLVITDKI
ncbi:hypothetical protein [Pedobacter sp. Hv1]|uniref:hypothetical protein n=1 Tax=Pedobacter sp. Hv1 TaxID=1740090 RepID=UPI0006D8A677|nr:hypothetical protein [Pedobacter sp. Hv1]KQC02079.1 hypothetical protein AQF98_00460 [Pedobacter sp. Hv1]